MVDVVASLIRLERNKKLFRTPIMPKSFFLLSID